MKLPTTLWHPFVWSCNPFMRLKTNLKSFFTKLNSRNKSFWMSNLPAINSDFTRTKPSPLLLKNHFNFSFVLSYKVPSITKRAFWIEFCWNGRNSISSVSWIFHHDRWKEKPFEWKNASWDHQVVFELL